jgi:MYXO-CTERM domain-containing protein
MTGDVDGGGSASSAFVEEMWSLYRSDLPPGTPVDTVCNGGSSGAGGSGTGGASGSAGSGGASASAGTGGSGTGGSGGNAAQGDDDGGCGCRTTRSPITPGLWLAAVVVVLLRRRARRP